MDLAGELTMIEPPEDESESSWFNWLYEHKDKINDINNLAIETEMYKDNIVKVKNFYNEIFSDTKTLQAASVQSWLHFLDRIVNAPTRIHMRGVVILCIPVIKRFLDEAMIKNLKTTPTP